MLQAIKKSREGTFCETEGGFSMKRFPSIKSRQDFQAAYRGGKSFANKQLVMYVKRKNNTERRIGISVSKKVGNSVVRHRVEQRTIGDRFGHCGGGKSCCGCIGL